ncbi:hypothetical protein BMI84_05675 [Vibrio parahaemolyticus]|nr:hypothetical protein BMI84_05675 [Vibrio parahaemolyticus]
MEPGTNEYADFKPGDECAPDQQNGTYIMQAHEWGKFFIFDKLLIILHLHNLFKNCSFVLLTPLCWASMFDKVFQICRLIG